MKRKSLITKIVTLCLACFILVTPLTIIAAEDDEEQEYSVNEDGAVMAGEPVGDRIYTIYTQSGRAFDVMNEQLGENSTVWTYPYNGDKCQEWRFIKSGSYYAIQDTNSQKYLTVLNNSSAENAQIVISSKPATGFSSGQLFSIQQIGTSMRYRIHTKCSSDQSLAIGYDSSHYLRQMATSDTSTQIYLEESAPYHGLQEGFVHIQEYNSVYAQDDLFLGVEYEAKDLYAVKFDKDLYYKWLVKYRGDGCFSFNNYENGAFLSHSSSEVGGIVRTSVFNEDTCLWRIIKTNDYYEIVPDSAYTETNGVVTIDSYLGLDNSSSPILVNTSNVTRKWRIIRSHYYYNYDVSMYVIEDESHIDSHAYIFDHVCSSLYLEGHDNQNLHYEVDDVIEIYDYHYHNNIDDDNVSAIIRGVTHMIDLSNIFIIYAHGTEDASSIILNAVNSDETYKGTKVTYNKSNITSLADDSLSSLGCAIFFTCHSAEGIYDNENSDNFVNAVMGRGAQSAIGFDGKVNCDDIEEFSLAFFTQYCDMVGTISARALESYRVAINSMEAWDVDDFSPYFTNGYTKYQDRITE